MVHSSSEEKDEEDVIEEEFELRDRLESEISHWWKTLTLISYFCISISGIATSISIGDLVAAFENNCLFYAKIGLKDIEKLEGNKNLTSDNVVVDKWGDLYDCVFCEYSAASSVVFGGMLFALFLQCGRGGITSKGGTRSWEIVLPALFINIVFFIISTVVFAKIIGGLAFFCNYILRNSRSPENITSCAEILSFRYPNDRYHTDLYLDYIIAQTGASLLFGGWLMALVIIIFRCLLGVDFVVYRRRKYAQGSSSSSSGQLTATKATNAKSKRKIYSQEAKEKKRKSSSKLYDLAYQNLSDSTDSDFDSEIVETTFIKAVAEVERKKLL